MNLEIVKRVISDAIPNNVSVSNIDIQEGNGKLLVQISWEVLKAADTVSVSLSDSMHTHDWRLRDGYFRSMLPLPNFDQPVPIDLIAGLPEAYRNKLKVEFEKSEIEANKLRAEKTENPSRLEELAKKITSAEDNNKAVRTAKTPMDKVVAVKGNDRYVQSLVRAGIDPESANAMAKENSFTPSIRLEAMPRTPKITAEGKIVTPVDLPIPKREPTVPSPNTKEEVAEIRKKNYPGVFRRAEPDGYATIIIDGKPKVVDGYERPRFVKKAFEVVAEYKKAVEAYDKRYANVRSPLAKKPNADDKGKRGVAALTAHSLPFSHRERKVTDVEVMFLADEKMAKLVEPPSLLEDLKNMEAKIPRPTKLKKILFHLKSIKDEILRK